MSVSEGNNSTSDNIQLNQDDQQVYNKWSNYFKYKMNQLGSNEAQLYETQEQEAIKRKQHIRCEKWKDQLINNSPMIRFLLQNLKKVNCPFTPQNFVCAPCDGTKSSAFDPQGSIVLCQNGFSSKSHLETTMAHELIHAFDNCRYNVDWNNLYHLACSEIRAASLSGDCRFFNELKRGKFGIAKQHQACVKRRAILSVMSHPLCPNEETAEKSVLAVFDSCFKDTTPFEEIY